MGFQRKRVEKTVWVPIDGLGIELKLRYLPRQELRRINEKAAETKYQLGGQAQTRTNPDILLAELARCIVDWRGVTREVYARLIPIEPEDYPDPVPCEDEYKRELLAEAYGLDTVVLDICTNLARFQDEALGAEIKN